MPLAKQYLKSKPICKVTFTLPEKEAEEVTVAGEFNDWKEMPLKKLKNGNFKGAVNVPVDASYEFKYKVDGTWTNDPEADSYKWNEFAGSENGIVTV